MKTKKLLSVIITLAMVLSLLPMTVSVSAEGGQQSVPFRYYDETAKVLRNSKYTGAYTPVTSDTKAWTTGWYVASGEVTIDDRVSVTGDVKLILADGCKLTVNGGINVTGTNSFTVFGHPNETGELIAVGGYCTSGIGGGANESGGTVNIYSGIVTANATFNNDAYVSGAGIGGGRNGNGGTINIYGGTVTASGCVGGAGIGGGCYGNGGMVNIYGGTVTANGSMSGAGIGGGEGGSDGTVNINGGTVFANSGGGYAGVGIGGTVTINGGEITASGGTYGAGIRGNITINDGNVTAHGFGRGTGITGTVTINGGTVTANAYADGAGIGGVDEGDGCTVTINGGVVTATGGGYGAGIGGGHQGNGGTLYINGGSIIANGGHPNSRGIGAGFKGSSHGNIYVGDNVRLYNNTTGTYYTKGAEQAWTDILVGSNLSIYADTGTGPVYPYLDYNAETNSFKKQLCSGYQNISENTTTLTDGWYVCDGSVTIDYCIQVTGNARLILKDRCEMTVNGGFEIADGGSFTVYAQSFGEIAGKLTAIGQIRHKIAIRGGTVIINGGNVTANGVLNYSGIYCNAITINGGNVTASGASSPGIESTVTVNGGTVSSSCMGGRNGIKGTLILSDNLLVYDKNTNEQIEKTNNQTWIERINNVPAVLIIEQTPESTLPKYNYLEYTDGVFENKTYKGNIYYPGRNPYVNAVVWDDDWYLADGINTINEIVTVKGDVTLILKDGCELTVTGGINVPSGSSLTIYAQSEGEHKGRLIASGANNYSGIGGGGNITIHGGDISATGGQQGAGIGGGCYGNGGIITISGGKVIAKGNLSGAGIGGGSNGNGGTVKISGGAVTAIGGELACGIGAGHSVISISNGTFETDGEVKVKAAENDEYIPLPSGKSVNDYRYTQIIGNPDKLSIMLENGIFTATTSGKDVGTGVVIVALYDSADLNRLLDVKVFDLAKKQTPTGTFTQDGYIRAYWWSDFETMIPICKPADWQMWTSENSLPTESGGYTLENDITLSSAWNVPSGVDIKLDLNGHTIDRGLTEATANGYVIGTSGKLTIFDSSEAKTGTITGGNNSGNGGGIYVSGGILTMNDVTLSGNCAINGGGIYLEQNTTAKLNLTDCKIENNTISERGSGFCLNSGNTTFTNCEITNNRSEYYGGGFFIDFTASVSLKDCTVSGNSAKNGGGAFEMEKDGTKLVLENTSVTGNSVDAENGGIKKGGGIHFYKGSVTLKGVVTIKDNTCNNVPNNICMRGNTVTFDASEMSGDSEVYVNAAVRDVIQVTDANRNALKDE